MASLDDLLYAMQNGVTAVNELNATLAERFPPIANPITVASTTAATLFGSSQVIAYATVTTTSGAPFRVALFQST